MLSVKNLSCSYHKTPVLDNLNFQLEDGELACILGPSGCGKTTLLRCLAGFEEISSGQILINEKEIQTLAPEKRGLGMVFQDYSLFPHISVRENIEFGIKKWSATDRKKRLAEMLELTGLSLLADRYPYELSGGQQQRVALARALAPKPPLILMDEPFSNLDLQLRHQLGIELREVLKDQKTSAIMVTHDQDEAFTIADKIGLLKQGNLKQWQTPEFIYLQPAEPWIAEFVGQVSWLSGKISAKNQVQTPLGLVDIHPNQFDAQQEVIVALRPEDFVIDLDENSKLNPVTVVDVLFRGSRYLLQVMLADGELLQVELDNRVAVKKGSKLNLGLKPLAMSAFLPADL